MIFLSSWLHELSLKNQQYNTKGFNTLWWVEILVIILPGPKIRISWMLQCPALWYLFLRSHECSEWKFHLWFGSIISVVMPKQRLCLSIRCPKINFNLWGIQLSHRRKYYLWTYKKFLWEVPLQLMLYYLWVFPAAVFFLFLLLVAEVDWQSGC